MQAFWEQGCMRAEVRTWPAESAVLAAFGSVAVVWFVFLLSRYVWIFSGDPEIHLIFARHLRSCSRGCRATTGIRTGRRSGISHPAMEWDPVLSRGCGSSPPRSPRFSGSAPARTEGAA